MVYWNGVMWSGRRDLNPRPPAPKAGALAKLRYAPFSADLTMAEQLCQNAKCGPIREEKEFNTIARRHRHTLGSRRGVFSGGKQIQIPVLPMVAPLLSVEQIAADRASAVNTHRMAS